MVGARAALKRTAAALAELDVYAALADVARRRNYCRPEIVEEPVLHLLEGRHPVLDAGDLASQFVPNDTHMDESSGRILIITGPNMAGKSTYIRQVALITLMAQMGSFVPAQKATIGLADRIFARVGASDELARGQSTFMVEMLETGAFSIWSHPEALLSSTKSVAEPAPTTASLAGPLSNISTITSAAEPCLPPITTN